MEFPLTMTNQYVNCCMLSFISTVYLSNYLSRPSFHDVLSSLILYILSN